MNKFIFLFLFTSINTFSRLDEKLRLDSHPYISGDSFRSISNHVLESDNPCHITCHYGFSPKKVKPKDIVFVEGALLEIYFKEYHNKIRHPYILITHNADHSCPRNFFDYLNDPKIIIWFASNPDYTHKKLIPIPIGLSNRHWPHSRYNHSKINIKQNNFLRRKLNTQYLHKLLFRKSRPYLLYVNFDWTTNPTIRKPIYNKFYEEAESYITKKQNRVYDDYLEDIINSKFTLCPPGNGLDCHRMWEAMWLGSIPVMISTTLDPLFEDLPVIIVKNWSQVSQKFLEDAFHKVLNKEYKFEKLYLDYWINLIYSYKNN